MEYVPVPWTIRSAPPYSASFEPARLAWSFSAVNEFDHELTVVLALITSPAMRSSIGWVVVTLPEAGELLVPVHEQARFVNGHIPAARFGYRSHQLASE